MEIKIDSGKRRSARIEAKKTPNQPVSPNQKNGPAHAEWDRANGKN